MTPKAKTKLIVVGSITLWLLCLSLFLTQSRFEKSLIFTQFTSGAQLNEIVRFIRDSTEIPPNSDPNIIYVVDTINTDSVYFVNDLEPKKSLREYAPEVKSQGTLGSCVSWASAYAGLTILKRIESGSKSHLPFDPMDLHGRLQKLENKTPCADGANIAEALNVLRDKGCPILRTEVGSCKNIDPDLGKRNPEVLFGFKSLYFYDSDSIKKAIANNMPVVFGINCYTGNYWENAYYDESGVWSGHYTGRVSNMGHAMCVVGYDDDLKGGAFEVMNSWGGNWGKDGYFWIKYSDFEKHVKSAYAMYAKRK